MSDATPARPGQVTLAGWLAIVGSVLVVVTTYDLIAGLHTVETRDAVEAFLKEPPGKGLGLSVDGALTALKVIGFVAAACATATGILGWQVLRRDRGARLGLTILVVPLFFSGLVAGGLMAALVAAAALLLWSTPARDWFTPEARSATAFRRPDPLVWACVLTWISTGVTSILLLVSGLLFVLDSDDLIAEVRKQDPSLEDSGLTDQAIVVAVLVMVVALILWAIGAAVLAYFVWRGRDAARIGLVVSAWIAGGLALLGILAGGVTLPLVAACLVVFRMLMHPEVVAWCRRGSPAYWRAPSGQ